MKHRKQRIAWSAACGLAALLLIALWGRSSWWMDQLVMPFHDNFRVQLASSPGTGWIVVDLGRLSHAPWKLYSTPSDDPRLEYLASLIPPSSPLWGEFGQKFANFSGALHGSIGFPYWLAISVIATAATGPWVQWRFSLRTLLLAATLVAVALGFIVSMGAVVLIAAAIFTDALSEWRRHRWRFGLMAMLVATAAASFIFWFVLNATQS
jgi:hypothetical protein